MNDHGTVKISLDSLGLMLSNAPPRFLLNQQEMENAAPQSLQKSFVFVSDIGSEDTGSIVVLGKNSLDTIQMESLASYEQIHRKSMTVDCKSIISSLTPPEVEKKLTEVLQENLRLKEALELNNLSMKQHLNILLSRQDELSRVHEAHKKKFAETKNLVSVLKTENNEYKMRMEGENTESTEQSTQTETQEEEEDHISRESIEKGSETKLSKITEKCEQQDQEIDRMQKIVASLRQQLESLYQNSFSSIKLEDLCSSGKPLEDSCSRQFLESFTRYREKLQALGNCYAAQTSRYTSIQECLRRCSELLTEEHVANETEEERKSLESFKRKELQEHRSRLIDEELKTICERQEMIKSQNEFQKIFTDYNSTLLEVESLRKETERLSTLQKGAILHDERLDEAKACLRNSENLLDNERRLLEQVRLDLTRQREEIERERIFLETEERKLIEANVSLHEDASLLRESSAVLREQLKIYENDWAEQQELCDKMRSEKEELLDHIRKLEEEKERWLTTMQCLHGNPID